MALASYQNVVDAVRDWLARPTDTTLLTDTRVADLIVMGETDIYDMLRVRDMETSTDLTVTTSSTALPTDLVEIRRVYMDGTPLRTLIYMTPPQFWDEFSANYNGQPRAYTVEGSNIIIGPTPDRSYTGKLLYYKRLAALSSATNSLFLARPNLWVYGALRHASVFIGNDERLATWDRMFGDEIAAAQKASDRATYSGAPLTIRAG